MGDAAVQTAQSIRAAKLARKEADRARNAR
jgi:hypothetical protein